jgi:hypothetical protein
VSMPPYHPPSEGLAPLTPRTHNGRHHHHVGHRWPPLSPRQTNIGVQHHCRPCDTTVYRYFQQQQTFAASDESRNVPPSTPLLRYFLDGDAIFIILQYCSARITVLSTIRSAIPMQRKGGRAYTTIYSVQYFKFSCTNDSK